MKKIVPIIFIIAGSAFLVGASIFVSKSYISSKWPTTNGRLLKSYVSSRLKSIQKGYMKVYYIDILYEYTIDSKKYQGKKISFIDKDYGSKKKASTALKRFIKNGNVIVYYNPKKHDEAVIDAKFYITYIFLLILPLIFIVAGIWTLNIITKSSQE